MEKITDEVKELLEHLDGETIKFARLLFWKDSEIEGREGDVFGVQLILDSGDRVEFYASSDVMNWAIY